MNGCVSLSLPFNGSGCCPMMLSQGLLVPRGFVRFTQQVWQSVAQCQQESNAILDAWSTKCWRCNSTTIVKIAVTCNIDQNNHNIVPSECSGGSICSRIQWATRHLMGNRGFCPSTRFHNGMHRRPTNGYWCTGNLTCLKHIIVDLRSFCTCVQPPETPIAI